MIEDDELRSIFKIESAEHIQRLEQGFLRLEKEPGNMAVLEEIFRDAHSLKGAARMLGLEGLESLSNRIEDILGSARNGSVPISSEIIDRLYKGLDEMVKLVKDSVAGKGTDASDGPGNTSGNGPPLNTKSGGGEPLKHDPDENIHIPQSPETAAENQESAGHLAIDKFAENSVINNGAGNATAGKFHVETMRVDTKSIDKLMSQAGELNVTKLNIAQMLDDTIALMALWDNIKKISRTTGVENNPMMEKFSILLGILKNGLHDGSSRFDRITAELSESIGRICLLPLSTIFNLFGRMVRDMARERMKDVNFIIEGGGTDADKRIIEGIKDPLMHILRNAVDHGIETAGERIKKNKPGTGTIILKAYQTPVSLVIEVIDDGRGLDTGAIKRAALKMKIINENELSGMNYSRVNSLAFAPGVSTSGFVSDISGRGVGLDVARTNVEHLKGSISIESSPDAGCTVRINLPLTLAASKVLIAAVDNVKYAVPVEQIVTTCFIHRKDIFNIHGHMTVLYGKAPVPVAFLSDLLDLKTANPLQNSFNPPAEKIPCIIISSGDGKLGLFVNELIDEQVVVLKNSGGILKRVRNISGSAILGTGEICLILNSHDLVKSALKTANPDMEERRAEEQAIPKKILIAEDSLTVRTQMKRILEGAGYDVTAAVDGLEAYNILSGSPFDALVSDIQMPNMTGLELTEKVRQDKKYSDMPVILVTSLVSDADRKRGVAAGANAYITKPSFDQKVILDTLRRLI